MPMPAVTIGEIVDFVGGQYVGDRNCSVSAVAPLAEAGENQLSFLSNRKYAAQLAQTKAGAILVPQNLEGEDERWVRVDDPYFAVARVMTRWFSARPPSFRHRHAIAQSLLCDGPQAGVLPCA
jgi:UDP-3-O-[3-hydroxymyristoyl] glucosamine N-acyltransferase